MDCLLRKTPEPGSVKFRENPNKLLGHNFGDLNRQ